MKLRNNSQKGADNDFEKYGANKQLPERTRR